MFFFFFFFKQKTAYEMCGRDWSSDVCSSDLLRYNNMSVSDALVHLYTFYSHIWNEVSCVRGIVWEGITPEGGGGDEGNIRI